MVGIIVIVLTVIVARYAQNQALKEIDVEFKAKLVDLFSGFNKFSIVFLIGIMLIYYWVVNENYLNPFLLTVLFFTTLFVYMVIQAVNTYNRLKKNDFPKEFIQKYMLSSLIRAIGMIAFVVIMFL